MAHQGSEFGNTLHDTPKHHSDNTISQEQTRGSSFGIRGTGSHEQTRADSTAETYHGDLIIAEMSLSGSVATDVELWFFFARRRVFGDIDISRIECLDVLDAI